MTARAQVKELFLDVRWRLNNLYYVVDKEGQKVKFELNWMQEKLLSEMHFLNLALKARQLGTTTFVQLFFLDACVFNPDVSAGTIAHNLQDAQNIFKTKVRAPYDWLPEGIRNVVSILKDNATELELSNNSSIRVGTSHRSGTLQYLHISEYGKLCAKFPEKAREVRTGALNTVQTGQIVFIESTAEGQEGDFYDLCEAAKSKARTKQELTPLDFKFHFFPWWKSPEYSLRGGAVNIPDLYVRYFDGLLGNHGIQLTDDQKAWYVKKAEIQKEDMKREYPSTPEEAFEASVEGAYYSQQMAKAETDQRIGLFPADNKFPVHTAWDIGYGDETAIWCFQILQGYIRLVGYYENSGEGMPHYLSTLGAMATAGKWTLDTHFLPHDIRVHEWTNGLTRIEQMLAEVRKRGMGKVIKVPNHYIEDGVNAVRQLLGICQFDAASCSTGIRSLKNYRKEWDEDHGIWKDKPRHDQYSHGADAFRSLAMVYRELKPEPVKPKDRILAVGPGNEVTLNDLWRLDEKPKHRRI